MRDEGRELQRSLGRQEEQDKTLPGDDGMAESERDRTTERTYAQTGRTTAVGSTQRASPKSLVFSPQQRLRSTRVRGTSREREGGNAASEAGGAFEREIFPYGGNHGAPRAPRAETGAMLHARRPLAYRVHFVATSDDLDGAGGTVFSSDSAAPAAAAIGSARRGASRTTVVAAGATAEERQLLQKFSQPVKGDGDVEGGGAAEGDEAEDAPGGTSAHGRSRGGGKGDGKADDSGKRRHFSFPRLQHTSFREAEAEKSEGPAVKVRTKQEGGLQETGEGGGQTGRGGCRAGAEVAMSAPLRPLRSVALRDAEPLDRKEIERKEMAQVSCFSEAVRSQEPARMLSDRTAKEGGRGASTETRQHLTVVEGDDLGRSAALAEMEVSEQKERGGQNNNWSKRSSKTSFTVAAGSPRDKPPSRPVRRCRSDRSDGHPQHSDTEGIMIGSSNNTAVRHILEDQMFSTGAGCAHRLHGEKQGSSVAKAARETVVGAMTYERESSAVTTGRFQAVGESAQQRSQESTPQKDAATLETQQRKFATRVGDAHRVEKRWGTAHTAKGEEGSGGDKEATSAPACRVEEKLGDATATVRAERVAGEDCNKEGADGASVGTLKAVTSVPGAAGHIHGYKRGGTRETNTSSIGGRDEFEEADEDEDIKEVRTEKKTVGGKRKSVFFEDIRREIEAKASAAAAAYAGGEPRTRSRERAASRRRSLVLSPLSDEGLSAVAAESDSALVGFRLAGAVCEVSSDEKGKNGMHRHSRIEATGPAHGRRSTRGWLRDEVLPRSATVYEEAWKEKGPEGYGHYLQRLENTGWMRRLTQRDLSDMRERPSNRSRSLSIREGRKRGAVARMQARRGTRIKGTGRQQQWWQEQQQQDWRLQSRTIGGTTVSGLDIQQERAANNMLNTDVSGPSPGDSWAKDVRERKTEDEDEEQSDEVSISSSSTENEDTFRLAIALAKARERALSLGHERRKKKNYTTQKKGRPMTTLPAPSSSSVFTARNKRKKSTQRHPHAVRLLTRREQRGHQIYPTPPKRSFSKYFSGFSRPGMRTGPTRLHHFGKLHKGRSRAETQHVCPEDMHESSTSEESSDAEERENLLTPFSAQDGLAATPPRRGGGVGAVGSSDKTVVQDKEENGAGSGGKQRSTDYSPLRSFFGSRAYKAFSVFFDKETASTRGETKMAEGPHTHGEGGGKDHVGVEGGAERKEDEIEPEKIRDTQAQQMQESLEHTGEDGEQKSFLAAETAATSGGAGSSEKRLSVSEEGPKEKGRYDEVTSEEQEDKRHDKEEEDADVMRVRAESTEVDGPAGGATVSSACSASVAMECVTGERSTPHSPRVASAAEDMHSTMDADMRGEKKLTSTSLASQFVAAAAADPNVSAAFDDAGVFRSRESMGFPCAAGLPAAGETSNDRGSRILLTEECVGDSSRASGWRKSSSPSRQISACFKSGFSFSTSTEKEERLVTTPAAASSTTSRPASPTACTTTTSLKAPSSITGTPSCTVSNPFSWMVTDKRLGGQQQQQQQHGQQRQQQHKSLQESATGGTSTPRRPVHHTSGCVPDVPDSCFIARALLDNLLMAQRNLLVEQTQATRLTHAKVKRLLACQRLLQRRRTYGAGNASRARWILMRERDERRELSEEDYDAPLSYPAKQQLVLHAFLDLVAMDVHLTASSTSRCMSEANKEDNDEEHGQTESHEEPTVEKGSSVSVFAPQNRQALVNTWALAEIEELGRERLRQTISTTARSGSRLPGKVSISSSSGNENLMRIHGTQMKSGNEQKTESGIESFEITESLSAVTGSEDKAGTEAALIQREGERTRETELVHGAVVSSNGEQKRDLTIPPNIRKEQGSYSSKTGCSSSNSRSRVAAAVEAEISASVRDASTREATLSEGVEYHLPSVEDGKELATVAAAAAPVVDCAVANTLTTQQLNSGSYFLWASGGRQEQSDVLEHSHKRFQGNPPRYRGIDGGEPNKKSLRQQLRAHRNLIKDMGQVFTNIFHYRPRIKSEDERNTEKHKQHRKRRVWRTRGYFAKKATEPDIVGSNTIEGCDDVLVTEEAVAAAAAEAERILREQRREKKHAEKLMRREFRRLIYMGENVVSDAPDAVQEQQQQQHIADDEPTAAVTPLSDDPTGRRAVWEDDSLVVADAAALDTVSEGEESPAAKNIAAREEGTPEKASQQQENDKRKIEEFPVVQVLPEITPSSVEEAVEQTAELDAATGIRDSRPSTSMSGTEGIPVFYVGMSAPSYSEADTSGMLKLSNPSVVKSPCYTATSHANGQGILLEDMRDMLMPKKQKGTVLGSSVGDNISGALEGKNEGFGGMPKESINKNQDEDKDENKEEVCTLTEETIKGAKMQLAKLLLKQRMLLREAHEAQERKQTQAGSNASTLTMQKQHTRPNRFASSIGGSSPRTLQQLSRNESQKANLAVGEDESAVRKDVYLTSASAASHSISMRRDPSIEGSVNNYTSAFVGTPAADGVVNPASTTSAGGAAAVFSTSGGNGAGTAITCSTVNAATTTTTPTTTTTTTAPVTSAAVAAASASPVVASASIASAAFSFSSDGSVAAGEDISSAEDVKRLKDQGPHGSSCCLSIDHQIGTKEGKKNANLEKEEDEEEVASTCVSSSPSVRTWKDTWIELKRRSIHGILRGRPVAVGGEDVLAKEKERRADEDLLDEEWVYYPALEHQPLILLQDCNFRFVQRRIEEKKKLQNNKESFFSLLKNSLILSPRARKKRGKELYEHFTFVCSPYPKPLDLPPRFFFVGRPAAEVIFVTSTLSVRKQTYFKCVRLSNLLACTGIVYYQVDANVDSSSTAAAAQAADARLLRRWKRQKILRNAPHTHHRGVLVPQLLVDGQSVGSYDEVMKLQDDGLFDTGTHVSVEQDVYGGLLGSMKHRLLLYFTPSSRSSSTSEKASIAVRPKLPHALVARGRCPTCLQPRHLGFIRCTACGSSFRELLSLRRHQQGQIVEMYRGRSTRSAPVFCSRVDEHTSWEIYFGYCGACGSKRGPDDPFCPRCHLSIRDMAVAKVLGLGICRSSVCTQCGKQAGGVQDCLEPLPKEANPLASKPVGSSLATSHASPLCEACGHLLTYLHPVRKHLFPQGLRRDCHQFFVNPCDNGDSSLTKATGNKEATAEDADGVNTTSSKSAGAKETSFEYQKKQHGEVGSEVGTQE